MSLGLEVRNLILRTADILREPSAPGWVALALVVTLVGLALLFVNRTWRQLAAIRWLQGLVTRSEGATGLRTLLSEVNSVAQSSRSGPKKQIAETWQEFDDTLMDDERDGEVSLRNTIRPSFFFNAEDLGFSPRFPRYLPGLFVSTGLFLTFLGLISALNAMKLEPGNAQASLSTLLTIASAKFIMSLTGLLCSIVFTIILRLCTGKVDSGLHQLCHTLERKLSYVSLEELALQQLRATEEQRDRWRELGYELVAELGRPLREELPSTISGAIRGEMAPLIEQVSRMGSDGMGTMVADLSERFSGDVGRALGSASDGLTSAAAKIGDLAGRLDQSSGRMGTEMEQAVARLGQAIDDLRGSMGATAATASNALTEGSAQLLAVMNRTLEGIRNNTGEGARAMSAAAAEMREAAVGFRAEIEGAAASSAAVARDGLARASAEAGMAISSAFSETAQEIAARAEVLTGPMDAIAQRIQDVVTELTAGAREMRHLSDAVRSGAEAGETAAETFRAASQALAGAAQPIRETTEQIAASVRGLSDSVGAASNTVTRSAEQTARSATSMLEAAGATIGAERRGIEAALAGVTRMLEAQRGQGDRLDTMDEKLGQAFEQYRAEVQGVIDAVSGHVRDMTGEMNAALDVMRGILEQAEEFRPQQARRA